MKYLVALVLLAAICAAQEEGSCMSNVVNACTSNSLDYNSANCNARFGGIKHSEPELQAYINLQLAKSYQYLLLATYFNSYQRNRPGFQKLYQGLSDRSFDDAIDLMKHVTKRGGKVDFSTRHADSKQSVPLEQDELHSLSLALESEKQLSRAAMHVHNHATHAADKDRDGEIAHYMEEKYLGKQADSVRKLSGYANDLMKMMDNSDPSLAVYLFDEFLQKQ